MVEISKAEKEVVAERYPDIRIVRTMKQDSKRHHYYCEEDRRAMRLINEIRAHGVQAALLESERCGKEDSE